MNVLTFFKNWTLPIAMVSGVLGYFTYVNIPLLEPTKPFVNELVTFLQPFLIFCMLFLAFCKVKPSEMRLLKWHIPLLLIQSVLFGLITLFLSRYPDTEARLVLEGAMLCLLCPTATACAVVTMKLGGSAAAITTYTILINLVIAIIGPVFLPIAHPQEDIEFLPAFIMIIKKIFPLLIMPLLLAWFVRYFMSKIHLVCMNYSYLAFYIWAVGLALAIGVTCKALMHTDESMIHVAGIAIAALVTCIFQFMVGKRIGRKYSMEIEAGQSLGQKNTIFIIWLGYTFLSPVTATAGGFYSVFHNLFNSYQLYKYRKKNEKIIAEGK